MRAWSRAGSRRPFASAWRKSCRPTSARKRSWRCRSCRVPPPARSSASSSVKRRAGSPAAREGRQGAERPLAGGREMTPATHQVRVTVRWGETDPAGIVFYPRFFEWFDRGTEALFESLGLGWTVIFPRYGIVGVPIVESGARFVAPVRHGDEVGIRS